MNSVTTTLMVSHRYWKHGSPVSPKQPHCAVIWLHPYSYNTGYAPTYGGAHVWADLAAQSGYGAPPTPSNQLAASGTPVDGTSLLKQVRCWFYVQSEYEPFDECYNASLLLA